MTPEKKEMLELANNLETEEYSNSLVLMAVGAVAMLLRREAGRMRPKFDPDPFSLGRLGKRKMGAS